MAHNTSDRFPPLPKYYRFSDPSAYQHQCPRQTCSHRNKKINAPFLSKAARVTPSGNPIWTHAYYKVPLRKIVPNCTSMISKVPRFPYEAFSQKDLEDLLCRCGLEPICECPTDLEQENKSERKVPVICQRKVRTKLYKGSVPRPIIDDETKQELKYVFDPPFYDTRVKESTAFYHGCKWSKRSAKKEPKVKDSFPGPTYYDVRNINMCGKKDRCAEYIQFIRKKYSRQLRYIEQITEQHVRENRPGPASYNPKAPKGTELMFLGSRGVRFPVSKLTKHPGPADYFLKRDFDPVDCENFKPCLAKLPERPCFGSNGPRFIHRIHIGPSPADYSINKKICNVVHCNNAPFGSTMSRFNKEEKTENQSYETSLSRIDCNDTEDENTLECPKPTWTFRSKINRFKALIKDPYSPSPADNPQPSHKPPPSKKRQQIAPFLSSDMRFSPWFNWIPIHQSFKTPGPCYYKAKKAKCYPAVHHGPLVRSCRFKMHSEDIPAPNAYEIGGGVETILKTHNKNLLDNIKLKQEQFPQVVKKSPRFPTYRERELKLLVKCLSILDYGEELFTEKTDLKTFEQTEEKDVIKEKMLRCFVYKHYFPHQV